MCPRVLRRSAYFSTVRDHPGHCGAYSKRNVACCKYVIVMHDLRVLDYERDGELFSEVTLALSSEDLHLLTLGK